MQQVQSIEGRSVANDALPVKEPAIKPVKAGYVTGKEPDPPISPQGGFRASARVEPAAPAAPENEGQNEAPPAECPVCIKKVYGWAIARHLERCVPRSAGLIGVSVEDLQGMDVNEIRERLAVADLALQTAGAPA